MKPPPSAAASVRAHKRVPFVPRAEFGTSRTMLQTSLSAKKSSPVNRRLFFAPATSQKNGSLRQPAKKRSSPALVHGLAKFLRLLLRRADDTAGIFQFYAGHGVIPSRL